MITLYACYICDKRQQHGGNSAMTTTLIANTLARMTTMMMMKEKCWNERKESDRSRMTKKSDKRIREIVNYTLARSNRIDKGILTTMMPCVCVSLFRYIYIWIDGRAFCNSTIGVLISIYYTDTCIQHNIHAHRTLAKQDIIINTVVSSCNRKSYRYLLYFSWSSPLFSQAHGVRGWERDQIEMKVIGVQKLVKKSALKILLFFCENTDGEYPEWVQRILFFLCSRSAFWLRNRHTIDIRTSHQKQCA